MATRPDTPDDIIDDYSLFPFPVHCNSIRDDYMIQSGSSIGVGVNGPVMKCKNRQTNKMYALKILQDTPGARREIILHKRACENCEYIVKLVDVYINALGAKDYLYIIMEYMAGGELFNRIKNRANNPYTEREAATYIKMLVEAICHLHSMDIAHRDLKPENLLLTDTTEEAILKVGDFGFAKYGRNEPLPLATPLYTPYYVAPEILGYARYDKTCDIWSLGVIIYILLCGYPPFYSENQDGLSPGMRHRIKAGEYEFPDGEWRSISETTKMTIKRMLTVDPTQRITINEIREGQWLNELTSNRTIEMVSLVDEDLQNQLQAAVASATDQQRRNDDLRIDIKGPDASHVGKRAAKRQHKQTRSHKTNSTTSKEDTMEHKNNDEDDSNDGVVPGNN